MVTGLVFVLAAAGIAFLYSYLHYIPGDFSSFGRQGRYFIFAAPLFFLAFAGLGKLNESQRQLAKMAAAGLLVIVIGFYSLGIYTTYYTYCGSSFYTFEGCMQPVYKNLDVSKTAPRVQIRQSAPLTQSFSTNMCSAITGVDALVKDVPQQKDGALRLQLLDSNNQVVKSRDFPLAGLARDSAVSLDVAASDWPQTPRTSQMTLRLEMVGQSAPGGPAIAIAQPRQYRDGIFSVGGVRQDADLVFHFTCANPWTGK